MRKKTILGSPIGAPWNRVSQERDKQHCIRKKIKSKELCTRTTQKSHPTNIKIPKSKFRSKVQNMDYGTYTNNKKMNIVSFVFEVFRNFPTFRMYFGIWGAFFTTNCYFEYRIRILCI